MNKTQKEYLTLLGYTIALGAALVTSYLLLLIPYLEKI